jgi:hypothetical protein
MLRGKLTFCLFVGVLTTSFVAIIVTASDRRDRDGNLDHYYDIKAERIFEGFVAGKGHIIGSLMYFPLKTADTVLEVQLGPKEFIQHSTFIFKPGDLVVVVGVPVVLNERGAVLAREISGMNGTLVFRNDDGVRYPSATRSERIR